MAMIAAFTAARKNFEKENRMINIFNFQPHKNSSPKIDNFVLILLKLSAILKPQNKYLLN